MLREGLVPKKTFTLSRQEVAQLLINFFSKMTHPIDKKETHPKKQLLHKFLMLCVLLAAYFSYLSFQYGVMTGGIASALTWYFFVLCTPIADAGFLLDFPLRLLFGIRMLISEIIVWIIAIGINIYALIFNE